MGNVTDPGVTTESILSWAYIIYKVHTNLKNECITYCQPLLFYVYIYIYSAVSGEWCSPVGTHPEKTLRGDAIKTSKKFSHADL